MTKEREIIIQNKLIAENCDINIYHCQSGSAHLISCSSTVKFMLSCLEDDFLHISLVRGQGNLEHTFHFYLPQWIDFDFYHIQGLSLKNYGTMYILKVPPGIPGWELRVKAANLGMNSQIRDIIIADEGYDFPAF